MYRWLVALSVAACQGETVASTTDAQPSDAQPSGDSNDACRVAGNLVSNGDFASGTTGWKSSGFTSEPTTSPCGAGIRLKSTAGYATFAWTVSSLSKPIKSGTRFRLRAMFRDAGRAAGSPPNIAAWFSHVVDGGDVSTEAFAAESAQIGTWHTVEAKGALDRDEDKLLLIVSSRSPDADTFDLTAVSLIVE